MRSLRVAVMFMSIVFFAFACGGSGSDGGTGSGSGSGSSGSGGDNTGSAGGGYVYDDTSDTLTITISSSDFDGDCGPEPGTEEFTITELTATTMTWQDSDTEEMTWTRNSGNAGDPVGTWTMSEDGVDLQLIVDGDGGFSLSGTCSDGGTGDGSGSGSGSGDACDTVSNEVNGFLGTWTGLATYTSGSESGQDTITLGLSGTNPTTVSFSTTESTVTDGDCIAINGQGEATFILPNTEPGDPDCTDWDVTVTGQLGNNGQVMSISASGIGCNDTMMTVNGDLTKQ